MIQTFIPGRVRGQGSMSLFRGSDGTERVKYPPETVLWRNQCIAHLMDVAPERAYHAPVSVSLEAVFTRPVAHWGTGRNRDTLRPTASLWCAVYPDLDKVCRLAGDALTAAGVVLDDALIARWMAAKRYVRDRGERAGLHLRVEEL